MRYNTFIHHIQGLLKGIDSKNSKINLLREELQKLILASVFQGNKDLYLLGSTNLRLSYNLNRYSENLDFTLGAPKNYDIENVCNGLSDDLVKGKLFPITYSISSKESIHTVLIIFQDILYDSGITTSPYASFTLKLKIDTNPPKGGRFSTKLIKTPQGVTKIQIHDIETTFSGKIGALLISEGIEGSDYYDIYWYFDTYPSKKFNLEFLQNIIEKFNSTAQERIPIPQNHKEALNLILEKIENQDLTNINKDLKKLVTVPDEKVDIFFKDYKENLFDKITRYFNKIEGGGKNKIFRL